MASHNGITLLLPYFEQGNKFAQFNFDFDWNATTPNRNDKASEQDLGGILICPSSPADYTNLHVTDYLAANRVDIDDLAPLVTAGLLDNKNNTPSGERAWDNVLQFDYMYLVKSTNQPDPVKTKRRRTRSAEVTDGLSNTWMYFEDVGKPFVFGWYESGTVPRGNYNGERFGPSINAKFRWASPETWITINGYCNTSQMVNCNNVSNPYSFHTNGILISSADGHVDFINEDVSPNVFCAHVTMQGDEVVE